MAERLKTSYSVYVIDKKKNKFLKKINYIKLDLSKKKQLLKLNNLNIDIVVHLAAQSTVDLVKKNKSSYINDNIKATENLVNYCKKKLISKFIFASTASVYEKSDKVLNENSVLSPNNLYGVTKLKNERYIKKNLKNINTKYCILRFFNVCSSDKKNKIGEFHNPETHLIPIIINKILTNKKIKIYGDEYKTKDGTCVRDYIHVLDIVNAIKKSITFLDKNNSEIFNLGSNKGFSVLDIVSEGERIIKKFAKKEVVNKRFGDNSKSICDVKKAKKKLRWIPKYSNLKKIIQDEIFWFLFLKKKKINRRFFY